VTTPPSRDWTVLLIGGASGSGKTSLSYPLARHFGVALTEADDIHLAVRKMTTPEQRPVLHYFDAHRDEVQTWAPERILEHFLNLCRELEPAYEVVIANHLESGVPLILEGDYLLPALARKESFEGIANNGRVRSLFVLEDDEAQYGANYLAREPHETRQDLRARVSWLHSRWLAEEAAAAGGIALPSRPWGTGLERALAALAV
jgi:2-phosphoglycerate kinase